MINRALKITFAIVGLMAIGALGLYAYHYPKSRPEERNNPYKMPGTVWTNSVVPLGYGNDLILLQDSTYASIDVCDICPRDEFVRGTWLDTGNRIILTSSEKPHGKYVLLKEERNNCTILKDVSPHLTYHPTFVKRSSDSCMQLLLHEIRNETEQSGRARP